MTILASAIIACLFVSETRNFMQTEVVNHMRIDRSFDNEVVKLKFDIEFPRISCNTLTFSQESSRGSVQTHAPDDLQKTDIIEGNMKRGCRVHGYSKIDRVGGNMKIGKTVDSRSIFSGGFDESAMAPMDLAHKINHLTFLPENADTEDPKAVGDHINLLINRQINQFPENTGVYAYTLQVIPTQFKTASGNSASANQYSVAERSISTLHALQGVAINKEFVKDFYGLAFFYDFYPVRLDLQETRTSFLTYLGSICAILGGVFTMFGLVAKLIVPKSKND